ncbi:MAG: hypothetical protein WDZ82_03400 [Candidatus Paceibacterota bacterium]
MRSSVYFSIVAVVFSTTLITTAVFVTAPEQRIEAQGGGGSEHFGGRFTTITNICCDGTIMLEHEAVESSLPDGTFKTSWAMSAYRQTYYYPLPQSCALGFVTTGTSCVTLTSFCESSETPDYDISMVGSSFPGCQFSSGYSGGGGGGGDGGGGGGDSGDSDDSDSGGGDDDSDSDTDSGDDGSDTGGDDTDEDEEPVECGEETQEGSYACGGELRLVPDYWEVREDRDITLSIVATGGAGGPYEYEVLTDLPDHLTQFEVEEGGLYLTGEVDDDGNHYVDIRITDREGGQVTDTLRIRARDDD